ncbi:aromatic ring-hydroxylating dioxygenase subunit alpha [Nitriliruptoraceae bacterium ZYF776]|nr:aromatic ring-hydroxylating dioxygenase subunit alpha [Profundirhabdus halotolerans]
MLSADRNRQLCEVGAGTPMGELLRRYWHPIAGADELDAHPTRPVRILGEDLTLYRDGLGRLGLIDRHCPHRRADLSYGIVEDEGLRCNYHGWLFDGSGACLHQPFEEARHPDGRFRDKVAVKAYPVQERAGMVWAYLGPDPAPLLPDWEMFHARGYQQVVISEIPCNWFQCQENSIDPVHFEWLHTNWSNALRGSDARGPRHLRLGFEEFEFGFVYRRVREDTDEAHELWSTGRVCLWPNALYTHPCEWRVPIDDERTLSIAFFTDPLPGDAPYEQERIRSWRAPIVDETTGRWIDSHVMNQDYIAWMGQGTVADRTLEHLGESDRGILLLRRRMFEQMQVVADGGDPIGLIRDPERNHRVHLPTVGGLERAAAPDGPKPFFHLAGQPPEITAEYEDAWRRCASEGAPATR